MEDEATRRRGPDWRSAPRAAFHVPIVVLAICGSLLAAFALRVPGGLDLSGGPAHFLWLSAIVWALAFTTRLTQPASRLALGLEALALFLPVVLLATFASVTMMVGSGPFVDASLVAIDQALFPFLDLRSAILALPDYPVLLAVLKWVYGSMVWQPLAFIAVATVFGSRADLEYFLSAWSVGLLLCLLPFHWLAALSPYNYFGIAPAAMDGFTVGMQKELPLLLGLRDGSVGTISIDTLGGLVSVPSFHACAATMLACCWWKFRRLRWPMLALNAAMALAAMPIGSHYAIDIVAGAAVGLAATRFAAWFLKLKDRAPASRRVGSGPVLQPA